MLYTLKNRLRLSGMVDPAYRINTLGDIQKYDDGTVITVNSVYGMDFIEIIAGRGAASCSITFFDLPTVIQPHRYPGIIGTGGVYNGVDPWNLYTGKFIPLEVEGIDYIKTYYALGTTNCDECSADKWSVCKAGEIPTGIGPSNTPTCLPFIFDETFFPNGMRPFRFGDETVEHIPHRAVPEGQLLSDYINNHCIYSLSTCQAEIIRFGADDQGAYFIWKAYTEWSSAAGPSIITFSRTGLGYMDLRASIDGPDGPNLCKAEGLIKVDCCEKNESLRRLSLWWESLPSTEIGGPTCIGQSFTFYGSMTICEVPAEVYGLWTLLCVSWMGGHSKTFFVFPEIKGSCLPFEWTVSNSDFVIIPSIPDGESAELKPAGDCLDADDPALCTQEVTVTVKDRCGVEDKVTFLSCCTKVARGDSAPLSINYSYLYLGCGTVQTLSAIGGCGPYEWSYTGNGTLTPTTGTSVTYTSPTSNPDCTNNDTVTVTDCCGNTSTLTFYASCSYAGDAFRVCKYMICSDHCSDPSPYWKGTFAFELYGCQGEFESGTYWDGIWRAAYVCYDGTLLGCPSSGFDPPCTGSCLGQSCNTAQDKRTALMKANGCCPINPYTGLPF